MKGKSYEINIHICTYEKSEYRFSVKNWNVSYPVGNISSKYGNGNFRV